RRSPGRKMGSGTTGGTKSTGKFFSFRNELLGFAENGFFLWVAGARYRFVDWKPLDAINLPIVLGGVSIGEFQQVERNDFEDTYGRFLPFRHVGVLDGVELSDDRARQAGFLPGLALSGGFRFFAGLYEAFRESPGLAVARLNQGDFRQIALRPVNHATC